MEQKYIGLVWFRWKELEFDVTNLGTQLGAIERGDYLVIWDRQGLFGVIPPAVVENALEALVDRREGGLHIVDHTRPVTIRWEQVVPLDSQVARLLYESQQLCQSHATTDSGTDGKPDQKQA